MDALTNGPTIHSRVKGHVLKLTYIIGALVLFVHIQYRNEIHFDFVVV